MRRPIAVFATCDDRAVGVCRQIEDHGPQQRSSTPHWCKVPPRPSSYTDAPQNRTKAEEAPSDPPDDPGVHFSADTQARRVRNGSKRTPGYKMKSNGFARPYGAPERGKFHRQGPLEHLRNTTTANQAGNPRGSIPWSKGRTRRRILADKACASKAPCVGRHRDGIVRTAARHPPLRASEKRGAGGPPNTT